MISDKEAQRVADQWGWDNELVSRGVAHDIAFGRLGRRIFAANSCDTLGKCLLVLAGLSMLVGCMTAGMFDEAPPDEIMYPLLGVFPAMLSFGIRNLLARSIYRLREKCNGWSAKDEAESRKRIYLMTTASFWGR